MNTLQLNILKKLQIPYLKPMQEDAMEALEMETDVVLLSPTGTGKTLAFLLPLIAKLDPDLNEIQAMVVVPSRELAMQINSVIRTMGSGFKTHAIFGGQPMSLDRINLKHRPAILIGTPGRIADHFRKKTFPVNRIKTLILDEFDKSLERGFEVEMQEVIAGIPKVKLRILTSATNNGEIPAFVKLKDPRIIDYLDESNSLLTIKTILAEDKDKLECLFESICHLGDEPVLIFVNFKDSIQKISQFLTSKSIYHGVFHGGLTQKDRDRALIQFRNGSYKILLATDLAARGIDVPEIKYIIHYHLPAKIEEFSHRNGRTARMNSSGTAYLLKWTKEELPDFIEKTDVETIKPAPIPNPPTWKTLFLSGGRKDKISKGDILGFIAKKGELEKGDIGKIEVETDFSFVAVKKNKIKDLVDKLNNQRVKKKKVRVEVL